MHESLDARFQFDKGTVRHQIDHPPLDRFTDRILGFDTVPRIRHLLFDAEADALPVVVDVEHHHVEFLPDLQHFRRMVDAPPTHVRDVEQTVETVQIDEGAEIGDVLDRALANVARSHHRQQFLAAFGPFLFDQFPPRQHDVLPLAIDFQNLVVVGVTDERLQVLGGNDVDLGRRQKRFHSDIDEQAALDHAFDRAGNGAAFVANRQDLLPILFEFGSFLGEDHRPLLVFQSVDQYPDFVAHFDLGKIFEFCRGNGSFTLITDIDQYFFRTYFYDCPFDDFAGRVTDVAQPRDFFHRKHNRGTTLRADSRAGLSEVVN